ncbi:MAG: preprotein translocase subunit SecG [Pseudomonadota bacterium]
MLLGLLLTLNIMICLALIGVVLLQRSEGGALGGGGNPTGLITTRGAGDLLTRTTWILFTLFLTISLALTLLGGRERSSQSIINRLKLQSVNPDTMPARTPPAAPGAPSPGQATPPPVQLPPLATAGGPAAPAPAPKAAATARASPPRARAAPSLPAPVVPAPVGVGSVVTLPPLVSATPANPPPQAKPGDAATPAKPNTP